MWDLQTTIKMNEKQTAEQIAKLAKMFNKTPHTKKRTSKWQRMKRACANRTLKIKARK